MEITRQTSRDYLKLFEYEAKEILSKQGIPTPRSGLASDKGEARRIASKLKMPVAVKAQILFAGRGKAGGILFAQSIQETENAAERLFNSEIKGIKIHNILIEEMVSSKKELYLSVTVDRSMRAYVIIASSIGGIHIEETAATLPERIIKFKVDLIGEFHAYQARQIAKKMGYSGNKLLSLGDIILQQYEAALEYDVELMEINPLIETPDGKFVAADARIIVDDNSLFRHPEFKKRRDREKLTLKERDAQKKGLMYVQLEGNIGVIGNGAGLVMASLDMINLQGGKPANFLDVGGGATSETMTTALNLVLSDRRVRVVLVNILGGITRCDEIARGILKSKIRLSFSTPLVVRLMGTNEQEGRRLLVESGIYVFDGMETAAEKSVQIAKMVDP